MSLQGVLVVDDDIQQRSDLAEMVDSLGFEAATAADGEEALGKLASFPANVILTDLVMPRMDGVALLKALAARGDRTPTIVLTGFGSVDQAISFVQELKAFWFLEKPVQSGVLRTLLERAIQQHQLIEETQRLNRQLSYRGVLDELTGDSPSMKEVFIADPAGRPHYRVSVHYRREWNGEGIGGARHPSPESPKRRSVCSRELRGAPGHTRGERTLRS